MRTVCALVVLAAIPVILIPVTAPPRVSAQDGGEWQITFSPVSKLLDNNDNFSRDDRFLVVDTRDTLGGGIGNGNSIMKVHVATGQESVIYSPPFKIDSSNPAPGLGAASFSPFADEAIFIHGPLLSETASLGFYNTRNRRGGVVKADGSGDIRFVDYRDVSSDVTIPGAHRGGSHRHEFALASSRIGFTYDDFLLQDYGRTIGYMEPSSKAPPGVTHWAALLVKVALPSQSKPGDLERAADDSWVGAKALMRAFIGNVKEANGSVTSSLFVVDIPEDVDITTSDSGARTRYMTPPNGVTIRRLTRTPASGIVRGSLDGTRIGYYATADDGSRQVFIINAKGSDQDANPAMRPAQATSLDQGASSGLRWHPSGNSIAVLTDNGVAAVCVKPGPLFGAAHFLTTHGAGVPAPEALVWSHDGSRLAFNRRMPTYDYTGKLVKDAGGNDFRQIFLTSFPDANQNGIADPIEQGVIRNAAGYQQAGTIAPDSWAGVFAYDLAKTTTAGAAPYPPSLGGVSVEVTDGNGATTPAAIGLVSPEQINFIVPGGARPGQGRVTVTKPGGEKVVIPVQIAAVAPGLFSANSSGRGVAAAIAVRIYSQGRQTSQPVFTCTAEGCSAVPLEPASEAEQLILMLFGTGIRNHATDVTATIGGVKSDVIGVAAQGEYPALDQVNVRVPASLAGRGQVPVVLTADGKKTNAVVVNIR